MWIYFFIFTFLFQKRKIQPPEKFCEKRCSLKFCKFYRKTPVLVSLFKIKLQVFKNTYFEELLWTTASKKIGICSIVKVLLLRRIKLLNSSVNKKKKHVQKFDVRSHVTTAARKCHGKRKKVPVKEIFAAKEKCLRQERKRSGQKEKSSRQKKITYGKKKKMAAKEKLLQQKKVTHRKRQKKSKRSREKHH